MRMRLNDAPGRPQGSSAALGPPPRSRGTLRAGGHGWARHAGERGDRIAEAAEISIRATFEGQVLGGSPDVAQRVDLGFQKWDGATGTAGDATAPLLGG